MSANSEALSVAVNPFVSNRYHFGMLLGVDDLETEQGYHRGKTWLHNSWLHGEGVVWGLGVSFRPERREVVVAPGLAITAAGREVYLDREHCVDIASWFERRRPEGLDVTAAADGGDLFDIDIVIGPRVCLDRPVPAISEPCSGAEVDVAHSRAVEAATIDIVIPDDGAGTTAQYPRLRQFAGVAAADDADVITALAELDSAAPEDRGATWLTWFRRLAADDVTDLEPPAGLIVPAPSGDTVLLARLRVHLSGADAERTLVVDGDEPSTCDNRVRPAHVATTTAQELAVRETAAPAAGPGIDPDSLAISATEITLAADSALHGGTVSDATVSLSVLDGTGWQPITPSGVTLDADGVTIRIALAAAVAERPLRIVVRGTGVDPVASPDGDALAGGDAVITVRA